MLALEALGAHAFDAVLGKGALDALLADGGDGWAPSAAALRTSRRVDAGVAAVLVRGGVNTQPHFKRASAARMSTSRMSAAEAAADAGGEGDDEGKATCEAVPVYATDATAAFRPASAPRQLSA